MLIPALLRGLIAGGSVGTVAAVRIVDTTPAPADHSVIYASLISLAAAVLVATITGVFTLSSNRRKHDEVTIPRSEYLDLLRGLDPVDPGVVDRRDSTRPHNSESPRRRASDGQRTQQQEDDLDGNTGDGGSVL